MDHSVVVLSVIPELVHHLQMQVPHVTFHNVAPGSEEAVSKLRQTQIVIADIDLLTLYLDDLHSVKWVQSTWFGFDKLMPHFKDKEIPYRISKCSHVDSALAMSEYIIAGIVRHERNQNQQYENQKMKKWSQDGKILHHRCISDLTVGILGVGTLGKQVARILNVFGATVWGLSRSLPKDKLEYLHRHITTKDLPKILRVCDYVINILPFTEKTKGLLNGEILKNCEEKKSVFINVGRGNVIREPDLIRAIEKGWISAAILDVYNEEPLPQKSKLWTMPQVTISPHVAAMPTSKTLANVFAKNYAKYLAGEEIPNTLQADRGY